MTHKMIFDISQKRIEPTVGSLLVAEPFLREGWFNHGVICLIECDINEPTMGVVMNRETDFSLKELIPELKVESPIPVFCGGPLSTDRLFFIHSLGEIIPDARPIANDLWLSGDFDAMIKYINSGYPVDGIVRFFIGYSGWAPGQLDDEIKGNTWAVAPPGTLSPEQLLSDAEDPLWHLAVRSLGPDFRGWSYHPQNISAN